MDSEAASEGVTSMVQFIAEVSPCFESEQNDSEVETRTYNDCVDECKGE